MLYLENPPAQQALAALLGKLGISARDLLRKGEDDYKENNLKDPSLSEAELIAAMHKYPKLIERPIVEKGERSRYWAVPPENVLDLI